MKQFIKDDRRATCRAKTAAAEQCHGDPKRQRWRLVKKLAVAPT